MSLLLCFQLALSLGKGTWSIGAIPLTTAIINEKAHEQQQLPSYDIKMDTYQYNSTNGQISTINTNLVGGTVTLLGTCT